MIPRIGTITLGVADLERSVAFYRDRLGFPSEGIVGQEFDNGAVAFFDLDDGLRLALWPLASMASDTGEQVGGPLSITLGHIVATRQEVDAVIDHARRAGARIVREPVDMPWGGYSGYFADPDGHLWEAVWIPEVQG